MHDITCYVIEYDGNGVAYLVDVDGRAVPIPLEHGALISVESDLPPAWTRPLWHTGESV